MLPSDQNDNVRNKRHTLQNDRERYEETDGAPHGAEITVAMAVLVVGEVLAGTGERGTAFVKTVGVVNLFAAGLSEEDVSERPVREWER